MKGIYFEKITFGSFLKDVKNNDVLLEQINQYKPDDISIDDYIKKCYDSITLPTRKTKCSAGYDFVCPFNLDIKSEDIIKIPTGIKAHMPKDIVLTIHVRSSLGIKKHLMLCNSVGIIDADYYNNPANEGDIIVALKGTRKTTNTTINKIDQGDCIVQGIFLPYFTIEYDNTTDTRIGGIGSTSE